MIYGRVITCFYQDSTKLFLVKQEKTLKIYGNGNISKRLNQLLVILVREISSENISHLD